MYMYMYQPYYTGTVGPSSNEAIFQPHMHMHAGKMPECSIVGIA